MSVIKFQNGPATGQTSKDFKQAEMFNPADSNKPFHVKITPGTDLYIKVSDVAIDLGISPTNLSLISLTASTSASWRSRIRSSKKW